MADARDFANDLLSSFSAHNSRLAASVETRIERCEYCQDGWAEGEPSPTPGGPHYPYTRCTACGGTGEVTVERRPIMQEDLPE